MPAPAEGGNRLHTWKEIAAFLNASVRAVQMWEREAGLPVQRPPNAHGRVAADPEELRRWLAQRERPIPWWENRQVRLAAWWAVPLLLLVTLAHDLTEHHGLFRAPEPVSLSVNGRFLSALDNQQHEIWRLQFEDTLDERAYRASLPGQSQRSIIEDVNGDGRREILFVEVPSASGASHRLHRIDMKGRLAWSYPPQPAPGVALITILRAVPAAPSPRVILAHFCQLPDHAGSTLLLSPDGQLLHRYEHGGHIDQIAVAGQTVLLGGECARNQSAEVHRFRLAATNGSYSLLGEGEILFPRSCLSRLFGRPNRVSGLSVLPDGYLVTISEFTDDVHYEVFHELNPDLTSRRCWPSDAFRTLHRRLEMEGHIRHPLSAQEERALCQLAPHPPSQSGEAPAPRDSGASPRFP